MPIFSTPNPIAVSVDLSVGHIRMAASEREDTIVEVLPTNSSHDADVRIAEQTRVELVGERLRIKGPKQRGLGIFGKTGSIEVSVQLPTGSQLDCGAAVASVHVTGELSESRLKLSSGDCALDITGSLDASTGAGAVTVEHVKGDLETSTGSGHIQVRRIDGSAVVKNSNGDIRIGTVVGALRAKTANGTIDVELAESDAIAATANGDVRFGSVESGSVSAKTAAGKIHVGIRPGTAARIDAHTSFGRVDNQMTSTHGPASTDRTVDVSARTSYGDIVLRRSDPPKTL